MMAKTSEKDYIHNATAILRTALDELDQLGSSSASTSTSTSTSTCTSTSASSDTSRGSSTFVDIQTKAQENFRRAFPGLCGRSIPKRHPSNDNKNPAKKAKTTIFIQPKETWTHTFCFLGEVLYEFSPSKDELYGLQAAGLGKKKIVFPNKNGNHEEFMAMLQKECPKIKYGGGIELLQAIGGGAGKRKLGSIVPGPQGYTIPHLRGSVCVGQAITYIRPLQKDLDLSPVNVIEYDNGPKLECLTCNKAFTFGKLKEHKETCGSENAASENHKDPCNNNDERNVKIEEDCVVDLTAEKDMDTSKDPDESLANILDMFPDKSYREVQKKYAQAGSVEATIAAFLDDDDDSLLTSVFDAPVTLDDFRQQWLNSSLHQPITIERHCSKPLREIFTLYKKGINIRATPDVEFVGEDGSDASGPTREYFHLSMSLLTSGDSFINLFEGEQDHLMPVHCVESLDSLLFYYTGLMISHSFLHDGYPIVGLSKAAVAYIVTSSIDEAIPYLSINDIPDYEIRLLLERVKKANTDDEFMKVNQDEAIINILTAAGFVNKLLCMSNRDAALEAAMIHNTLIVRKLEMEDIRRGMEIIAFASFLKSNKELWESPHIFPRLSEVTVSAESVEKKLVLHSIKQDELDEDQDMAFNWCKKYVRSLPVCVQDAYSPTTGRFLQFVLGSPQFPTQPVYVKFNRKDKSLPDPDACLGVLSLPVNNTSYYDFKLKMDATLSAQATGYGRF